MVSASSAKGKAKASTSSSKLGAPSSKSGSRKSKASWRKAVDISEVEEQLEEKRTQERLLGSAANEKDGQDGTIFTLDRTGDEAVAAKVRSNRAGKRPLKSLEILQSKSAVAPFSGRNRSGSKQAALPSKAAKDKLRRLANKTVRGPLGGIVESEQSRLQDIEGVQQTVDRDIWDAANSDSKAKGKQKASREEEADQKSGEEWIEESQRKPVKVPKTLSGGNGAKATGEGSKLAHHDIVQISRTLPAVAIPHPGQSYNPDVDSHEKLIQQAYEIEKVKEMEQEALRRYKKQWEDLRASERDAILKDKASKEYLGMQVDQQGSDLDELEADEDEEEDDLDVAATSKKDPKRKTRAHRARAKRAKEEQRAAQERKMLKQLRHLMTQLPSIRKSLQAEEKARTEAAAIKRKEAEEKLKQQGMQGQKIGKNFVQTDVEFNVDQVQLGEDLTENLRALKTEGNLFRDRFQRLQTRALAEPRMPVVAKRRLGQKGRKEYETHSYKRFT